VTLQQKGKILVWRERPVPWVWLDIAVGKVTASFTIIGLCASYPFVVAKVHLSFHPSLKYDDQRWTMIHGWLVGWCYHGRNFFALLLLLLMCAITAIVQIFHEMVRPSIQVYERILLNIIHAIICIHLILLIFDIR
jgi:hypothetical protein